MDVRLLGPLEAHLEARPIELGPRKQRAVLAMLALEVGRTVSVDRLAEGLWGEAPPATAPKMVQLYVSHLRRAFDGNGAAIVTRGRGYELRLTEGDVDAVLAERLVGEDRPREALALWRGEPLADVADEPFAAAEIRRLEELRLRATELAIDGDLAAGRHAGVVAELDRLVATEPLREGFHARRMLALYRSGRQAEALDAFRAARATLIEEIGVEPGIELQELQAAILAHDHALDPPRPSRSGRVPPPAAPTARRRLLLGAAALLLAGSAAFGVIRILQPDGLAGIGENAVGVIDAASGRITSQYRVGRGPSAIAAGAGSVWIANGADGTVSRVDRERDELVTITVGGEPAALAFARGSLWVADSASREVVQVDPSANRVVRRITIGNAPRALVAVGGALWVASGVDGRIRSIDLGRGRAARTIAVGANPSALTAGAGALWVASEESGTVTRIDPRTAGLTPPMRVGNGPSAIAAGEGAVWVVNRHDGTLSRIDPATNSVTGTVGVGRDPVAVTVGDGAVWVAGGEDGTVVRVDPAGPRVIDHLKTGSRPAAVAVAGGDVWAAAEAPRAAHMGGTLRVLMPDVTHRVVLDWLHWRFYTTFATFQLSSLAYDGLVGYRRVEGAAGATLVGALATTAPAPSRDGRTYVFTLRPGLRYSDGRPVRTTDFRASMERFLQATRPLPPYKAFPPLFSGIAGARRCMTGRAPCDLSRGIEANPRARTITVHLTAPDSEFLHKLTMPFAFVVPAGSPTRATTGPPPPGTGPYRVTDWSMRTGGTFVRNPHFRSTPSRSRGEGFANRIDVDVRQAEMLEPQIAAVQRGDADFAVIANPFGTFATADRLRALAATAPSRLHSNPAPNADWMFLNVHERPFDDVRVRRAVNLALDRSRVVDQLGGPEVGQPACQIVPPGFPGHVPYCPYTAGRGGGGGWIAPDIGHARRLVAASGRAGERVVVHVPDIRARVGRYFVRVLDRLGFHATLEVSRFADHDTPPPSPRDQAGFVGWGADYLAASTFIETNFGCAAGRTTNLSQLCDPALEQQIDRALAASPADAAPAWAATDRRVTDLAAAVPLTTRRAVVLVSKRVGNVQHHPQWFTLLDQMWVR